MAVCYGRRTYQVRCFLCQGSSMLVYYRSDACPWSLTSSLPHSGVSFQYPFLVKERNTDMELALVDTQASAWTQTLRSWGIGASLRRSFARNPFWLARSFSCWNGLRYRESIVRNCRFEYQLESRYSAVVSEDAMLLLYQYVPFMMITALRGVSLKWVNVKHWRKKKDLTPLQYYGKPLKSNKAAVPLCNHIWVKESFNPHSSWTTLAAE